MKKTGASIMLAIQLPPDVEQRLKVVAERTGRSQSEHASEAILRYLEDLEDELIALERLERPERRWTLDDLERELDLER
jgi:RHH-type transcriptional regulator, rel operon repressor / antitoxin RelB